MLYRRMGRHMGKQVPYCRWKKVGQWWNESSRVGNLPLNSKSQFRKHCSSSIENFAQVQSLKRRYHFDDILLQDNCLCSQWKFRPNISVSLTHLSIGGSMTYIFIRHPGLLWQKLPKPSLRGINNYIFINMGYDYSAMSQLQKWFS